MKKPITPLTLAKSGRIALDRITLPAWYVRGRRPTHGHAEQMAEACRLAGPSGKPVWLMPPIELRIATISIPPKRKKDGTIVLGKPGTPTTRREIQLVDGRHRMLAATLLKLPTIPYVLGPATSDEAANLRQVETNLAGKLALSKEERNRAITDLLAQNVRRDRIAKAFRIHPTTVSKIKLAKPAGVPHKSKGKKRSAPAEPATPFTGFRGLLLQLHDQMATDATLLTPMIRNNEKMHTFVLTVYHELGALAGIEE